MQLTCSECDHSLRVKDELAGKKIKCPECGSAISVPKKLSGALKKKS